MKLIPDIVLEADINREKFHKETNSYTSWQQEWKSSKTDYEKNQRIESERKHCIHMMPFLDAGDIVWAYSYCVKKYLKGIVKEKKLDSQSICVETKEYPDPRTAGKLYDVYSFYTSVFLMEDPYK